MTSLADVPDLPGVPGVPDVPGGEADSGDNRDCRRLYRVLAASVVVVTAQGDDGPQGMTASSVVAVSLEPPLLAVTLAPQSGTLAAIRSGQRFAVNVLGVDQQPTAARFAGERPAWARFSGVGLRTAELPLLTDAVAIAVCRVEWERTCGDRVLVLGRVQRSETADGEPLLWHRSDYHGVRSLTPAGHRG